MKYGDYLFDSEQEEELDLKDKLLLMDRALIEVHQNRMYVSSNLLDALIVDNKILPSSMTFASFEDNESLEKAQAQDIMELGAIGICAYNRFGEYEGYPKYFVEPSFVNGLLNDVETYLKREGIPDDVKDYYRTIFTLLNFKYMTNYFAELQKGGKGNARVLVYSTPEGRAFANKENNSDGFTSIIAIPVILSIIYIVTVIIIVIAKHV